MYEVGDNLVPHLDYHSNNLVPIFSDLKNADISIYV